MLTGRLLELFSPLWSFPSCQTMLLYFLCLLLLVSTRSAEKKDTLKWKRLDKYEASTFHVQHADVWQFCASDLKGLSVLTLFLRVIWEQFANHVLFKRVQKKERKFLLHINQPNDSFIHCQSFSFLSLNSLEKKGGKNKRATFSFWLMVNWIVIHYPLCVKPSPLTRCLITSISVWHPLVTSRQLENITVLWPVCESGCVCTLMLGQTVGTLWLTIMFQHYNLYYSSAFCHHCVILLSWLCFSPNQSMTRSVQAVWALLLSL